MEVSFGKADGAATVDSVEQKPNTELGQPSSEPVKPTEAVEASSPVVGLALDKLPTFKEIILPRLNIVQGSGVLKDTFPFGSIVFNQQLVVYAMPVVDKQTGNIKTPGTKPLILTVLGFKPTRFAEKVSGGGRGMIVDTEDLVRANGGTIDYNEWKLKQSSGMRRFEPLADALVAIERPEHVADDDTVFVYPADDKKYTLAWWALKGTAYTAAAKRVFFYQRQMGCLRSGYPTFSYAVSTTTKTTEGNTYAVPVCLPNAKSTPAMLEFVKQVLVAPENQ